MEKGISIDLEKPCLSMPPTAPRLAGKEQLRSRREKEAFARRTIPARRHRRAIGMSGLAPRRHFPAIVFCYFSFVKKGSPIGRPGLQAERGGAIPKGRPGPGRHAERDDVDGHPGAGRDRGLKTGGGSAEDGVQDRLGIPAVLPSEAPRRRPRVGFAASPSDSNQRPQHALLLKEISQGCAASRGRTGGPAAGSRAATPLGQWVREATEADCPWGADV